MNSLAMKIVVPISSVIIKVCFRFVQKLIITYVNEIVYDVANDTQRLCVCSRRHERSL